MHFGDYTFIVILALILFGPKRLPEIARQAGRLMMEFRRASNEFKMQMEDELRNLEEEDRRKKLEAAAAETGNISEPHALPSETTQAETLTNAEPEEDHYGGHYTPPSPDEECIDPVDLLDAPLSEAGDLYDEDPNVLEPEAEAEDHGPEISTELPEETPVASYQPSDEPSKPITEETGHVEKPKTPQDPVRPESDSAIHHA